MANRNIFKSFLNPEVKVGRNGFDLSQQHKFTVPIGRLTPVFAEEVVPGDYFEIDSSVMVRTMPLNTAAFLRAKVNFDFFFIPMFQLWHRFPQFVNQVVDPTSVHQRTEGILYQPQVNLGQLLGIAFQYRNTSGLSMLRNLDLLGYGAWYDVVLTATSDSDLVNKLKKRGVLTPTATNYTDGAKFVSPFRLAAYRKIWKDYYQNTQRQPFGSGAAEQHNFDDLVCSTFANSVRSNVEWLANMMVGRQVPYKKDMFNGSLPSREYGSPAGVDVGGSFSLHGTVYGDFDEFDETSLAPDSSTIYVGKQLSAENFEASLNELNYFDPSADASFNRISVSSAFDMYAFAQARAMQRWKQNKMRAASRVKDQQLAQFGVSPTLQEQDLVMHIGGFSTQLTVDEVVSQAVTDADSSNPNGKLGALGGKGIGFSGSDTIKFKSTDFGIIMCVCSVVPDVDYSSSGIEQQNFRSVATDYFNPAFDNLGLSPVTRREFSYGDYQNTGLPGADVSSQPIGYLPRFYEYKCRVDKVHGNFLPRQSLEAWTMHRREIQDLSLNTSQLSTDLFYVSPNDLDKVFLVSYDSKKLDTDPILVNSSFSIKAVRPMSVIGELNL